MRSEFEHHFRYLVPKRDFTDSEPSLLIDEFTDQRFPIPFLLVDENHKELVVDSLWEAAGRPQDIAGGGNASLKGSQPGPSWTRSNLDQADMQTVVDLQAVADAAGYTFKRAAPMAMKLVSCTRGTSAEKPSWANWSPEKKATKTATINRQWDHHHWWHARTRKRSSSRALSMACRARIGPCTCHAMMGRASARSQSGTRGRGGLM